MLRWLFLFGSRAKGQETSESDADIAVYFKLRNQDSWNGKMKRSMKMKTKYGRILKKFWE